MMKLDSCGLPEDQFIEIFKAKAQFLGKLLVAFHPSSKSIMDEKIAWDMFQECVYAAEAEAQKITDPEGKNDPFGPTMFISRELLMTEIQSVNAKVESLVDYINKLVDKSYGKNDPYMPELYVSRTEMIDEIKAVNNKVDNLMDYLSKWQLKNK